VEAWRVIASELERSSPLLASRPRLVVASKCEGPEAEERAGELERAVGAPVLRMSSVTGQGVQEVLEAARSLVRA
jgi:GTP-binding protein